MSIVILRQLNSFAIDFDSPLCNPVSIPTDRGSKIAGYIPIICQTIETQYHIFPISMFIRNQNRHDTATEISDTNFHSGRILQSIETGLFPIDLCLKLLRIQSGKSCLFLCFWGTRTHDSCNNHQTQYKRFHNLCYNL